MKKNFSKIVIKLNGTESNLMILQKPWSIQFDPNRMLLTILDSFGNIVSAVEVLAIDDMGNWHIKCGDDEYLVYVKDDTLFIVKKESPKSHRSN